MWMAFRVVLILVALGVVFLIVAVALNRPPLFDAPGFGTRLKTYITTNTAELKVDHVFPELRIRNDARAPGALLAAAREAVQTLGWSLEDDAAAGTLHAVVTTRLWRFKDDVHISVQSEAGGSVLHVRSQSRVGRGDLGANARHVMDLLSGMAVP